MRKKLKELRQAIPPKLRIIENSKICHLLSSMNEWKNAEIVAAYSSLDDEVSTKHIIELAWAENKKVIIPRVVKKEKKLIWHYYTPETKMRCGCYGILEPCSSSETWSFNQDKPMIWLVPGLGFTLQGNRLGYGGGYYDRILVQVKQRNTIIGLAYRCQIVEDIPTNDLDQKVGVIISPDGIFHTGK